MKKRLRNISAIRNQRLIAIEYTYSTENHFFLQLDIYSKNVTEIIDVNIFTIILIYYICIKYIVYMKNFEYTQKIFN